MVGIIEASAAYNTLKAAFGIAQGLTSLNTKAEVNQAVIEIQRILLQAQSEAISDKETIASLTSRLGDAEARAADLGKWNQDKARYVLTRSALGAFTYDLRSEFQDVEAFHRLCVTCFNQNAKSVLHTKAKHSGGEIVHCGNCKSDLTLSEFRVTVATTSTRRDRLGGF